MPNNNNQLIEKEKKFEEPLWRSLISGGTAGAVAGSGNYFFESLKKKLQSYQPMPTNFSELYRGVTPYVANLTLTTMVQSVADNGFKRIFNDPMSNSAGIASAVASGAFSAFSSTAVENIILQQQLTKTRPRVAI